MKNREEIIKQIRAKQLKDQEKQNHIYEHLRSRKEEEMAETEKGIQKCDFEALEREIKHELALRSA